MRRFAGLVVVLGLVCLGPALAEELSPQSEVEAVAEPTAAAGAQFVDGSGKPLGDAIKSVKFSGELRTRFEVWVNLFDFDEDIEDDADFFDARERVGLGFSFAEMVDAYVELHANHVWGNSDPVAVETDNDDASIYLAYVDLHTVLPFSGSGGSDIPVTLRIGRQEITLPGEMLLGDNDRYDGHSFDALHLMSDDKSGFAWGVAVARIVENDAFDGTGTSPLDRVNQGGLRIAKADACADADLYAVYGIYTGYPDVTIDGYILYLDSRADPAGDAVFLGLGREKRWTIGGRVAGLFQLGEQDMDARGEIAFQTGDDGMAEDDISAFAAELEVGWTYNKNFKDNQAWQLRLAAGLEYASGDDDATDSDVEAFDPLFGEVTGRLGRADLLVLTNILAYYIEGTAKPNAKTELGIAFLVATAAEEDDVQAGGVARPATSTGDESDDVLNELDIWAGYQVTDNFSVSAGWSVTMPDEFITGENGEDDEGHRVFFEAQLKW